MFQSTPASLDYELFSTLIDQPSGIIQWLDMDQGMADRKEMKLGSVNGDC